MNYKVFQIGFNRCGTTSLHRLFLDSGYKSIHYSKGVLAMKIKQNIIDRANNTAIKSIKILDGIDDFDFYSDMEYIYSSMNNNTSFYGYIYFKDLYYDYPNSKFIFNYRPFEDWVKSRFNFSNIYTKYFKLFNNITNNNEMIALWEKHYYEHTKNVIDFFKDKPESILIYDISKDSPIDIVNFLPEFKLDLSKWAKHNSSKGKSQNQKKKPSYMGCVRASLWHQEACKENNINASTDYILIPKSFYERAEKLPKVKKYNFNFIGSFLYDIHDPICLKVYENRKWIIPFINSRFDKSSYLLFTDEYTKKNISPMGDFDYSNLKKGFVPRKSDDKLRFDTNYYEIMCSSEFTLCPAGDQMWSMRFYESLMCKSIPIVLTHEEAYRTKAESLIDYKYYLATDKNIVFRQDWAEHNYNLFIKYHTLS